MSQDLDLITDLNVSTQELRGSITELLGEVGLDPHRAQILAKQLRLDKSLAWKISTIVKAQEPGAAVRNLPGSTAFEIFLSAARNAGAAPESLKRTASAYRAIHDVIQRHTGDRPTLELVMDSMPGRASNGLQLSRKLAFRGNSGIWGVQAKSRFNTAFVAPAAGAPDLIDTANVGGWVDFRRLRADSRWALFRVQVFDTSSDATLPFAPIDPNEPADGPMLLREFCSSSMPPIQAAPDATGDIVYELGPSSIGNSGAFTCFFGSRIPRIAPRWAVPQNDRGEYATTISAPVEALQFDLLVHRDCEFATRTSTQVYGTLNIAPETRHARDLIPLELIRTDLGRFPAVVDTPRLASYRKIIEHAMQQCGWDLRDFIGIRYTLEYPPFPSTVIISFPLDNR